MNRKELSEIRRRIRPDRNSIYRIYGCYVNANGDIISEFDTSLGIMGEEETEMYLKLIRKAISGTVGKHLLDIEFTADQITQSENHRLLMKLNNSSLADSDARKELYDRIISSVDFEDRNFLILLASDTMDVRPKESDGESFDEFAEDVHRYFICAVCPVKSSAVELKYNSENGRFSGMASGQIAGPPETGFMFPEFTGRSGDIYNALYFTRKPALINSGFIENVFAASVPMSAPKQKHTFGYALSEALENECSMDVVSSLHEEMCTRIEEHRALKEEDALCVTPQEVGLLLRNSGVDEEKADSFRKECEKYFGENAELNPNNLVDARRFVVETPDVRIIVPGDRQDLVETRVIDGRKYILISADEGVTVNGIDINIE